MKIIYNDVHKSELNKICHELAEITLFNSIYWFYRPISVDKITQLAARYEKICEAWIECLILADESIELLLDAVRYIKHEYSAPHDNEEAAISEFEGKLEVLIQLARPCFSGVNNDDDLKFLIAIEKNINKVVCPIKTC